MPEPKSQSAVLPAEQRPIVMKVKDFRRHIFLAFLVYSSISLLVAMLSFWLFQRKLQVDNYADGVSEVFGLSLQAVQSGQNFLVYETNRIGFYNTGGSRYLEEYDSLVTKIKRNLDSLRQEKIGEKMGINQDIDKLKPLLDRYDAVFRAMVIQAKQRGYKGFGLESRLRGLADRLEGLAGPLRPQVMLLRAHERDYFLRRDTVHVADFRALAQQISARAPAKEKPLFIQYYDLFYRLVKLDEQLGIGRETGNNAILNRTATQISSLADRINRQTRQAKADISDQIINIFLFVIVVSVILILILAMLFKFITEAEKNISPVLPKLAPNPTDQELL
ncbi:MAG: hypothetical protein MUC97_00075 [Bernardetiaceae bacterium]|jgi:CHASE3 domain sensor protein|nr:hypothetical protein [Bernardetiaceae bacterium]